MEKKCEITNITGEKKPKNIKLSDNIQREQRLKEAEKPLYLVSCE